jgi:hypothetical protein
VEAPPGAERPALGAYGLRLRGLEGARELLVPADPRWPEFTVTARVAEPPVRPERIEEDRAEVRLRTGGRIEIDRRAGTIAYVVPYELSAEELVHPYLAPAATAVARWLGREALHAAAFAVDGRVWGLVGARDSGKSSTLAALAREGAGVVCDDMLVVDESTPFPGPRAIDLREDPARRLGVGEPLGMVGARERWRWRVPSVDGPLELAGWVFLDWGETIEVQSIPSVERLHSLFRHRGIMRPPTNPGLLVELAALPTYELRRPRSWASLAATCDRLLALATA